MYPYSFAPGVGACSVPVHTISDLQGKKLRAVGWVGEALKRLGFTQTGESKAIKLLIGTIDVRKLKELAELEAVIRVTPVRR